MRIVTPVRFVFKGDIERAKSHMNIARVMLGQMDARNPGPWANWYRELEDGTRMRLINNGGQRMAVIDSPAPITLPVAVVSPGEGIGFILGGRLFIYSLDSGETWESGGSVPQSPSPAINSGPLPDCDTFDQNGRAIGGFDGTSIFTLTDLSTGWSGESFFGWDFGNSRSFRAFTNDGDLLVVSHQQITNQLVFTGAMWAPLSDLSSGTMGTVDSGYLSFSVLGDHRGIGWNGIGTFALINTLGTILSSTDGKHWSMVFQPTDYPSTFPSGQGIKYFNGHWYASVLAFSPRRRQVHKLDDSFVLIQSVNIYTQSGGGVRLIDIDFHGVEVSSDGSRMATIIVEDAGSISGARDPVVSLYDTTDGVGWTKQLTKTWDRNTYGVINGPRVAMTSADGEFFGAFSDSNTIQSGSHKPWVVRTVGGVWEDITDAFNAAIPDGTTGFFVRQATRFSN